MRAKSNPPGWILLFSVLIGIAVRPGRGEGPLYVGGAKLPPQDASQPDTPGGPSVPGKPFVWDTSQLTYWTDRGSLGSLTKAQADSLVAAAFNPWAQVPTASLSFAKEGDLPQDIAAGNIMAALDSLGDCTKSLAFDPLVRDRTIVYDTDGSIFRALGVDPSMILGEASPRCLTSDGVSKNSYTRGFAILNGLSLFEGSTQADLQGVMTHEFGHLIGLDHSQVNIYCLISDGRRGCYADDLAGVPIMFPFDIPGRTTLAVDDEAAVSALYPVTANPPPPGKQLFSSMGRIQGYVYFSDGRTPAQGYNVIAREVADPSSPSASSRVAVSNVSGSLFTVCRGNPDLPQPNNCGGLSFLGSQDTGLIGFFDISGLPVANNQKYTLEVEAINDFGDTAFLFGSSVGPVGLLGFQFPLIAPCSPLYVNGAGTSCSDKTDFTPVAGKVLSTGTSFILTGQQMGLSRYDAWEDGP
jgi:hypothetical protein